MPLVPENDLLWLLNADRTDFIIIAMPRHGSSVLPVYMVDKNKILSELLPIRDGSMPDWHATIDSEAMENARTGEFAASIPSDPETVLYISRDKTFYAIESTRYAVRADRQSHLYLSRNETYYTLSTVSTDVHQDQ